MSQSPSLSLTGKRWLLKHAQKRSIADIVNSLIEERELNREPLTAIFQDMQKSVQRIEDAIRNKEKIAIFGDYDCDGITSSALLMRYFARRNYDVIVRLPHRIRDGYGLKEGIIQEFAAQDISLLITVDTGIGSQKEVALATTLGIDTIITDHHIAPGQLPDAHAILHPGLQTDFPLPHPSGAGVAYCLVSALENGQWNDRDTDKTLAMIGTVADVVELRGLNRQIVQEGLRSMRALQTGPLAKLRDTTKAKTSIDVAFRMAPRINAAGRMDDPKTALDALLHGGDALDVLDVLNTERQEQTKELYAEAERNTDLTSPLLWYSDEDLPHGIIGLIAGRLTERYGKPSCVVTIDKDVCTASLRSPPCYHITQGLAHCHDVLSAYGGHAQAAGCSFGADMLDTVRISLTEHVSSNTSAEDLIPTVHIDAILEPQQISLDLCRALSVLEPFGQANPEPRFLLRGVSCQAQRTVGSDDEHLQCMIDGIKCIGFRLGDLVTHMDEDVDVICRVGIDTWNGRIQPQIFIEDMQPTSVRHDEVDNVLNCKTSELLDKS